MPLVAAVLETAALVLALLPVLLLLASGPALLHPRARRGPNIVALVAGVVLGIALPVVWRVGLTARGTAMGALAAIVLLLAAQVGLGLAVLLLGWARLARSVRRGPPRHTEALVVLGAGLIGTRVTLVLATRLLAALALHRSLSLPDDGGIADEGVARPVPIVVSGGQGPDEVTSEAAAMAAFLLDHGVDPASVHLEDRSTSTRENLVNSAALVAGLGGEGLGGDGLGGAGTGRTRGPLVVVTNGFHVYRTHLLTRALHLDAVVVGCETPLYYLPRALARELAAVLVLHPGRRLATAIALVAIGIWLRLA